MSCLVFEQNLSTQAINHNKVTPKVSVKNKLTYFRKKKSLTYVPLIYETVYKFDIMKGYKEKIQRKTSIRFD
jgi:hypothetical protein